MTIFSTLRSAIAAERYDATVVLGAIAESAQALTGATAAALAMRSDGLVICRSRSGEMAPAVGSRLSVDSGISGECLRSGKVLRVDDTEKDYRADPEVCRRLGLRSIAAVPLRGRRGTMGVLEAFSVRPYAFAEEHMKYLIRLAELAEAARVRESGVVESSEDLRPAIPQTQRRTPLVRGAGLPHSYLKNLKNKAAILFQSRAWFDSRRLRLALGGVAAGIVILLAFTGWSSWHAAPTKVSAKQAPAQVDVAGTIPPAAPSSTQSDLVWKPSPAHVSLSQPSSKSGIETASKRELDAIPISAPSTTPRAAQAGTPSTEVVPAPSSENSTSLEPPQMGAITPNKTLPLASVPVELPGFGSPVSQGLSGGVLQHKVQPGYPVQALPLRLSGTVILQATIGESGRVDDLKVVSGPPILTAAAMDAVRQWRYSPFLLDGKPVKMQKQITISFRAP
jgi:protein TonB